jgi:ubiquinone/menaquinone biosynthesis C-methylase UbiE
MSSMLRNYINKLALQRVNPIIEPILPWLDDKQGKILDFGCGLGHIAFVISEKTKRQMTYLDVRKYPYACPGVKIEVFDGKTIPHPDKEFDTTLIIFVLHHVPNPAASLREVMRVSSSEIIICEDLVRSKKEMVSEAIKDTVANCFLPHMRMQYRIESDWEKMFTELGLKIKSKTYFNSRYIFNFNHVAWQLLVK